MSLPLCLKGRGRQWHLLPLLSPKRQCLLSQVHSKKEQLSLPVHPRRSSDCRDGSCHPSPQELYSAHQAQYQQQPGPLKLQSLSPSGCKNSQKPTPLILLVNDFGEVFFLCYPLWPLLSLSLSCVYVCLCDQGPLPSDTPMTFLSPDQVSTSPPLHDVASSLPLFVQFVLLVLR